MVQQYMASTSIAHKIQWTYWLTSEATLEKPFYVALQEIVAAAIRDRLEPDKPLWVGREIQLRVGNYVLRARLTNIDPPLASTFNDATTFLAQYHERAKDEGLDISTFIAEVIRYPNRRLGDIYDTLVGIDDIKKQMINKLLFLLKPSLVENWLENYYPDNAAPLLKQVLLDRYPLILLSGEVGSGKTALARSIGHRLATQHLKSDLMLYVVNAQVRGGGHVGELTQNISRAFTEAESCQEREQIPVMLFIDEADALAQERGSSQTHHEDDAGVNTLIQRIDRLRGRPMAVLFATNLFNTIDRAILRRATAHYQFDRPNYWERMEILNRLLAPLGFSEDDMDKLAVATNPCSFQDDPDNTFHRYTYSDITQRIIPYAAEKAIRKKKELHIDHLLEASQATAPTPEMRPRDEKSLEPYFKPES
jgi:SpoVK/Ycf46/Vps4 family AAA+-type ATPase